MANPGCKQFDYFKADAACVAKIFHNVITKYLEGLYLLASSNRNIILISACEV